MSGCFSRPDKPANLSEKRWRDNFVLAPQKLSLDFSRFRAALLVHGTHDSAPFPTRNMKNRWLMLLALAWPLVCVAFAALLLALNHGLIGW